MTHNDASRVDSVLAVELSRSTPEKALAPSPTPPVLDEARRAEIQRVSRDMLATIHGEYAWERDRKLAQDDAIIAARDAFAGLGYNSVWDVILTLCAALEAGEARYRTAMQYVFDALDNNDDGEAFSFVRDELRDLDMVGQPQCTATTIVVGGGEVRCVQAAGHSGSHCDNALMHFWPDRAAARSPLTETTDG